MIELRWKADTRLSALHLAHCAGSFPSDIRWREQTQRAIFEGLDGFADRLDVPVDRFWDLSFQLCLDCSSTRDLAERLVVRCLPPQARSQYLISELTASLQSIAAASEIEQPNFLREIALREAPLREQWEAYGPGLWNQLGQWIEPSLLVEQAEVFLVMPVIGGYGWPHLQTNRCHVEAVLTNAHPQITEVMRLCWLLSQLDFERPRYSELINARRLRRVSGLAMLPPLMNAAEELGLSRFSSEGLLTAITVWRIEPPGNRTTALAEVLMVWWDTFRSGEIDWSVALTGLDRMLEEV
ncbi:MAG: hypothetical protein U0930_22895 [Pirellulales bacterium]